VDEKVAALLPSSVVSGLVDSNWKERLTAVEKMTDVCFVFFVFFVTNIAPVGFVFAACI